MKQAANRSRLKRYAALVVAAALLPLAAAGSSIVDVMDWKPLDVERAAADDTGPDSGRWQPTTFPDTGIDAAAEPRWYEGVSGSPAAMFAGTWDAAQWTEVDFWSSSDGTGERLDGNAFLAELAASDWIGVSRYGNVNNAEIYGLDEYKLMVPEPAGMLLLGTAFGVAALALRRRGQKTAAAASPSRR